MSGEGEEQQVKMAIDALAGAETESVRTHEQGLFSVLFAGFCGKGQTVVDAVSAARAYIYIEIPFQSHLRKSQIRKNGRDD